MLFPSGLQPGVDHKFHRLNVSLDQPPGTLYPISWEGRTEDERNIVDLIQAHIQPFDTITDTADHLSSILAARFPKSGIKIEFVPLICSESQIQGLNSADCIITIPNFHSKSQDIISPPNCRVRTSWKLPIEAGSTTKPAGIDLVTEEHPTSNTVDHVVDTELGVRRGSRRSSYNKAIKLGRTHPTFDVHQDVITAAAAYHRELGDAAGLRIAQLAFEIADAKYDNKCLNKVEVGLKALRNCKQNPIKSSMISLSRIQYERSRRSLSSENLQPGLQKAYLALGSNIGDRISMIESACYEMMDRGLKVIKTSALYETKAMYLEDQQPFINGACEVS